MVNGFKGVSSYLKKKRWFHSSQLPIFHEMTCEDVCMSIHKYRGKNHPNIYIKVSKFSNSTIYDQHPRVYTLGISSLEIHNRHLKSLLFHKICCNSQLISNISFLKICHNIAPRVSQVKKYYICPTQETRVHETI